MNVLLMTSQAAKNTAFASSERMPPLGIGFLISMIRRAGHAVDFVDMSVGDPFQGSLLIDKKIDLFGLYLDTMCLREGERALLELQELREKKKWTGKIMVGGPHPTVRPEDVPQFVDHVVRGEGELAVMDILNGSAERVIQKEFIRDLDSIPAPAWDCFVGRPYDFSCDFLPVKPIFYLNTSRGCPYRCTFCSMASIWGQGYRTFTAERIVDDIEHLVTDFDARGIFFREDNFACSKKRTQEFCELMLKRGPRISWGCETRVDNLDQELLTLMHRAGCRGIFFGVESGSQRILDHLCKGTTLEQIEAAFDDCRRLGIRTYASFLFGLPEETETEMLDTIKFSRRLQSSNQGFNIFLGFPYSKLYAQLQEEELFDFVDESGMLYVKGHNFLVDQLMGGLPAARIPSNGSPAKDSKFLFDKKTLSGDERKMVSRFFFRSAGKLLLRGHRTEARRVCHSSLHYQPSNLRTHLLLLLTFCPARLFGTIRAMQLRYLPRI